MSGLGKKERAAIESVARRFSATWEDGHGPHDARIVAAGKRVPVDVIAIGRGTGTGGDAKLRLRFDKVATRLIEGLRASLGEIVPDGRVVLLTITAPIRVASKTAAALEDRVRALLGRGWRGRDVEDTIHGNRVRIRLVRGECAGGSKAIVFVHNSESDSRLLLDMASELLERFGVGPRGRATRRTGARWLVLTTAGGHSHLDAYRYIHSHLPIEGDFQKVLMVFADGSVGVLKE